MFSFRIQNNKLKTQMPTYIPIYRILRCFKRHPKKNNRNYQYKLKNASFFHFTKRRSENIDTFCMEIILHPKIICTKTTTKITLCNVGNLTERWTFVLPFAYFKNCQTRKKNWEEWVLNPSWVALCCEQNCLTLLNFSFFIAKQNFSGLTRKNIVNILPF